MNGLSNLDETYREYSLALAANIIRFLGSNNKGHGDSRPSR